MLWCLMELSLSFITLHEFAHFMNGHLSLLSSLGYKAAINESRDQAFDKLTRLQQQCLELDADGTAAAFLALRQLNLVADPQNKSIACFSSPEIAIELMFFCILHFFSAASYRLHDMDTLDQETHPPHGLRVFNIINQVSRWVETRYPNALAEGVARVADRAQGIVAQFSPLDRRLDYRALANQMKDVRMANHFNEVMATWPPLQAQIEPLKHGGRPRETPKHLS
ncbi:hypothetical protein [Bradyrhizobium sp. F1.13.3]|uniref:hypothetical protein n=1 Tax=Bradyrhizobium sp. F1.13.3 TaxID=3156351 RepID=UPI003394DA0F